MTILRSRKSGGLKNLGKFIQDTMNYGLEKTFGLYYSSYRAYVYDNEDPEKLSRVQLIIPLIDTSEHLEYWAFPKNNFSGKNDIGDYGMQCIPPKGAMVWVSFERGNLEKPVWEHGHFGKNEKAESLKNINNYWFKTPKGNLIELDDETGEIRITQRSGLKYVCSDKGISLIRNNKNISLGQLDKSKEAALLGDTTEKVLNAICDSLDTLNSNLKVASKTLQAVSQGPLSPMQTGFSKLNLDSEAMTQSIVELKKTIKDIKSQYITLD